jgi:hypothetical protein
MEHSGQSHLILLKINKLERWRLARTGTLRLR